MDVIFDYHAATGLLSTFLSGFSADSVQRGRSLLADKLGQNIVSENLSIYDDGTYDGGLNSGVCDGEGTASKRTQRHGKHQDTLKVSLIPWLTVRNARADSELII